MIFKSRNVRRTQADRGVSSEPQTCQMGVVAGHLKKGGNQARSDVVRRASRARARDLRRWHRKAGRKAKQSRTRTSSAASAAAPRKRFLGGHVRPRLRMCPPSSSDLGYGIAQVLVRVERKGACGKPAAQGPAPSRWARIRARRTMCSALKMGKEMTWRSNVRTRGR